ncbi:hypothetical protein [Hymenobacter baengnokdamensis]|uniref:hypothetical protein n=1 Tax=Hymenobacter baengnokdamensis TaxID=2615203 RepID=UPI001246D99A|nr:hypothetical protein [Hymenobacter baengnokdamensis]
MTAKNIFLALVGVGVLVLCFKFYQNVSAVQYLKKCQLVQPGMTVEQAERIMDDRDGTHHVIADGSLEYDVPLFARTGTTIYFDP